MYSDFYFIKNNILFKCIVDNGHGFEARVIPHSLVDVVLHLDTTSLATMDVPENICSNQTFVLLEGYENTNSSSIANIVRFLHSRRSRKLNLRKQILNLVYNPMEFICMDLVGEFHPSSSKGNRYTH